MLISGGVWCLMVESDYGSEGYRFNSYWVRQFFKGLRSISGNDVFTMVHLWYYFDPGIMSTGQSFSVFTNRQAFDCHVSGGERPFWLIKISA